MERERNLRIVMFTVRPVNVPQTEAWLGKRGHRVVGVLTAPGPRSRQTDGYLGVAQHARPGLEVIISNYPNRWADMIRPIRPDLIVCGAFNWKIPADVLQVPRLGAINGHDALLPRYRGRNATGWALRNDEPEYGMTIHRMTPALDDGPILAQRRIPITDQDDIDSLFPRWGNAVESAFEEAVERIEVHDPGIPQDESQVTYAGGAFEPEWRHIDWNKPARNIFLQIRSWWGSRDVPRGAFAVIDGQRALITKAWCSEQPSNGAAPGTVIDRRDDGSLLIQCADGPLEVVQWSIEEQA